MYSVSPFLIVTLFANSSYALLQPAVRLAAELRCTKVCFLDAQVTVKINPFAVKNKYDSIFIYSELHDTYIHKYIHT